MTERLIPGRPGLQPERTDLSWVRAALVVAIFGGLLLLREGGPRGLLSILGGSFAMALSIMMMLTGARRTRRLGRRPLPHHLAPRQEVLITGISVALLGVITLLMIGVR
ncbi:DUF202 domain-containing protein [Martelella soudanensis]|uniref:DUF202 domain-containing protein n=1 Tax=unclassified Martelella TaxID=2629616 RepID=UPI0015DFD823|nr:MULTISPECIES: DUF202 domain-containing protein [unclassified Martelella]